MDALSKGMERRMQISNAFIKPFIKLEYQRLRDYETDIFDYFENKTIISRQDLNELSHPNKKNVHVIPNGIDCEHFKALQMKKEYDVVFIGNMAYPPNIESGNTIVKKILPILKRNFPAINVLLSGANPHYRIKSLESKDVHVTGWVEDIRHSYAKGKVFLAPMTIGTGLQNKLLEAMAMKLPCVTSELANNSLGAVKDKEILVGNGNQEFAEHVIKLLNDEQFYQTIAENGYQFVINNFNWQKTSQRLERIILSKI
jgi:glycosyltransferase involved in cell wall biosynthesis